MALSITAASPSIVLTPDPITSAGTVDTAQDITTGGYPTFVGVALSGLASGNVVRADGSGNLVGVSLADGQLLVGQTGGAPLAANLTQGSGVVITNAAGAVTVAKNETYSKTDTSASYSVGTAGKFASTTVTNGGTATWTSAMVGGIIVFDSGETSFITGFLSSTDLTVTSGPLVATTTYTIWYGGEQETAGYIGSKGVVTGPVTGTTASLTTSLAINTTTITAPTSSTAAYQIPYAASTGTFVIETTDSVTGLTSTGGIAHTFDIRLRKQGSIVYAEFTDTSPSTSITAGAGISLAGAIPAGFRPNADQYVPAAPSVTDYCQVASVSSSTGDVVLFAEAYDPAPGSGINVVAFWPVGIAYQGGTFVLMWMV